MDEKIIQSLIPLEDKNNDLATKIIEEDNIDEVKKLVSLFNLNQAKKNVLRVLKLNSLLDKVSDQMIERVEKAPGAFNNSDLLNYMQVTQNAIDRANKALNLVEEAPAIQINTQIINNGDPTLNKESKEKVINAVNEIMKRLNKLESEPEENIELLKQPETMEETNESTPEKQPEYKLYPEEE